MDAFLVEFKLVVFAPSQVDAMERIRIWRALASAAGFEPGPARVSKLRAHELTPSVTEALEKARTKSDMPASDYQHQQVVSAIASHVAGDMDFARAFIASIESETGPLLASTAKALAHTRKAPEERGA